VFRNVNIFDPVSVTVNATDINLSSISLAKSGRLIN